MISELEIIRLAASLIRDHGDQAGLEATQRHAVLVEKGDLQAQSEWAQVVEIVEEIQNQIRLKGPGHSAAARSTFPTENPTGRPN